MGQEGTGVETETLGEAADVGKAEPRPRRALFTGAAAAGLGVAASLMFGERTARAANGGAVKLGESNTATATTSITTTVGSGLQATTSSDDGAVVGIDTSVDGSGIGVWGQSSYGDGVVGQTTSTIPGMSGVAAVDAGNGGGYGVYGVSRAGYGVYGVSSGTNPAIYGQANGVGGTGIVGQASSSVGAVGVMGNSSNGVGVLGTTAYAGQAGVFGTDSSAGGAYGVNGSSNNGTGVYGETQGNGQDGVYGVDFSYSGGAGVHGSSANGTGVYAESSSGTALQVSGRTIFSRSGSASIAAGATSVVVDVTGLKISNLALATLQSYEAGVLIAAAVCSKGKITIYLSQAPTAAVTVAWFVLN